MLKYPYVEWVLGVLTIGGTHEGLSYFKGKPGQFYEIPARFSFTKLMEEEKHEDKMKQLLQKRKDLENDKELEPIFQKIKKSDPQIIVNHNIFIMNHVYSSIQESRSKIVANQVVNGQALERLKRALKEKSKVTEEEFEKISNRVNFYICYFKYETEVKNTKKKKIGFMLTFFPKDCNTDEVYNVQGDKEVHYFTRKFALLEPRFLKSKVS